MFRLNEVLGFLKNELNYTHSQLLDFCNVIDGVCKGDDVLVKGSDIEVILGIADMRKLECEVVQTIDLVRASGLEERFENELGDIWIGTVTE
tara:strand:+ start:47 stop:322 length:276 start_codon:yes stop_codon:yes gene_type:complete